MEAYYLLQSAAAQRTKSTRVRRNKTSIVVPKVLANKICLSFHLNCLWLFFLQTFQVGEQVGQVLYRHIIQAFGHH